MFEGIGRKIGFEDKRRLGDGLVINEQFVPRTFNRVAGQTYATGDGNLGYTRLGLSDFG